ncbi:hypothetical protein KACHI17_04580 [Sediminibacterium sp. KACHI17]|uniref:Uncharacterized protein n=1 Tax=Sediminibacterium sp. KACHI17 TaxID=1751071 RepID=A0AAT9GG15_9BACT
MLQRLIHQPKFVFLFDALGALLTSTLIGGLLVAYQSHIGLPLTWLYILASIAAIFTIFSSSCASLIQSNWKPFLIIIITGNALYACLTTTLIIMYSKELTGWGFAYFIGEIFVLLGVIWLELKAVKALSH